jgi:formate C-acetyltransferase/4-hydroxyphenylacetate decarboxylase large subunit
MAQNMAQVIDKTADFTQREIMGKPSSERVVKRLNELWNSDLYLDSERCRLYTDYIKEHLFEPQYSRQGGAFKHILSNLTPVIRDDELIVGNLSRFTRGAQLYPEYNSEWIREAFAGIEKKEDEHVKGYVPEEWEKDDRMGIYRFTPEDRHEIEKVLEFWKEDWATVVKRVLRENRDDYDLVERWAEQLLIVPFMWDVPEGRVIPDYSKVLGIGLEKIIERCRQKIRDLNTLETKEKLDKYDFYNGTILALEGVIAFADNYAREAERLALNANEQRRKELLEIAAICRRVPRHPASTFKEAVQSFWFIHCVLFIELNGRAISPGRFDQYMYPFFKNDLASGRITENEVLELLELLRIKHTEFTKAHGTFTAAYLVGTLAENWTLGGVDRYGKSAENQLSMLILQAGINAKTHQPTLSVRWNDKLSEEFKLKAVECIKSGSGYPALFNDELALQRFLVTNGVTLEDARDWAPCGCVDMNIPGKRPPQWCFPNFNAGKALELVLNDGLNPSTGDKLIDTGLKIQNASYDEIKEAFKTVMETVQSTQAQYWNTAMVVKNKMGLSLPLLSAVLDDCIEKGLHCQEGGCRYNDSAYTITCGVVNVANSLAAIKKCVFEERLFTINELIEALNHNFEGNSYNEIQRHLLAAPKFGNDNDYADQIVVELYNAYSDRFMKNLNWLGEPWQPGNLSIAVNVALGSATGAIPDGRKSGEPLADGSVSAHSGTDLNGPTALIKSAAKSDASKLESQLFNMKFHPTAIETDTGSKKFVALNDTYFDLGGYHVQYNIVDVNMLRDAQKHPEKYPDLLVRIAGFTVRWVELGPAVQEDIIRRTEYGTI